MSTPTTGYTIAGAASGTVTSPLPVASTIDAVNDYIPIYTASATATQAINRNTYLGLASAPAGLTDSQTLTNKTLTSPTINGATLSGTLSGTYVIGGTPTFPSTVVTTTGTQTLTNKTLTSPTINSPTITNATLSSDTITGYTTSNSGSIYGISVVSGVITGANTIGNAALQTNAVQANQLATTAITLGYAQITSDFTTTNPSATYAGIGTAVTIPSGGRKVKITAFAPGLYVSGAGNHAVMTLWSGTSVGTLTTQLTYTYGYAANSSSATGGIVVAVLTPSAGAIAYSVALHANAGTATIETAASGNGPAFILVEAI